MPKDYYTLECILYLLKNINLNHVQYVRQAAVSIFLERIFVKLTNILACDV